MFGNYLQTCTKLDSAEWTAGVVTDYDVSAQTLFVNCNKPKFVSVRSDQTMTVKFNSASNPAITVAANTAFELYMTFHHMYITTTVGTAVKVLFTQ